jgi:hypothetical protein
MIIIIIIIWSINFEFCLLFLKPGKGCTSPDIAPTTADTEKKQKIWLWQQLAARITPTVQRVVEFAKRVPGTEKHFRFTFAVGVDPHTESGTLNHNATFRLFRYRFRRPQSRRPTDSHKSGIFRIVAVLRIQIGHGTFADLLRRHVYHATTTGNYLRREHSLFGFERLPICIDR